MERLQTERPDMTENEIMREVLGQRPGWERGIGPIPPAYVSQYVPPPPPQRNDQRTFSQAEVEQMIAARLASEQENWQSQMMATMMSQMQAQLNTQVQDAFNRVRSSQQNDQDEAGPSNS